MALIISRTSPPSESVPPRPIGASSLGPSAAAAPASPARHEKHGDVVENTLIGSRLSSTAQVRAGTHPIRGVGLDLVSRFLAHVQLVVQPNTQLTLETGTVDRGPPQAATAATPRLEFFPEEGLFE